MFKKLYRNAYDISFLGFDSFFFFKFLLFFITINQRVGLSEVPIK